MYESTENLAYDMRMYGLKANIARRCEAAIGDSQHPSELINLLLQDEQSYRKEAVAKRMLSRAKFRSSCQMEDWDRSYDRGLSAAKFKELSMLRFYYDQENLILVGKTGVGKTHLAIALGQRACQDTNSTLFFSTNLLFEEIQAEKIAGNYLKFVKKITKTKLLILDDFGLRPYNHDEATSLLEILEERYAKGVTIITSQIAHQGWVNLFEDSVIAEAIIDRLINPSSIIELKGESYRKVKRKIDPQ